uniref:Ig-like domain-containing protein n=1 Tax=Otolemur garnettii TaxID=30611 RepID=H0XV59_OTOGA
MLLLPFQLLAVLLPGADNEDDFQGPTSLHVIWISSFANRTWAQSQLSGWLDDLQIHSWDSDSGTIIFLKPWSKGNFSEEKVAELEELIQIQLRRFIRDVQAHASEFQLEYPIEIQGIAGCELHSGGSIVNFFSLAIEGLEFMKLVNDTCIPSPEWGRRAQQICTRVMEYHAFDVTWKKLLLETCPLFLLSVLDAGKAELQRQGKPEAWLSSGPSPGPGRLLLVCHVSGFYPKPVWVMWMQGEQEQPGTQHSDLLPNADWTWYLRATLDVESREAAGLSCRVKHSSLEGQDIVLYWGQPTSIALICLAVLVPSFILLLCFALCYIKRRFC